MHRSRLGCLVIDCQTDDLDQDARFWADALGAKVTRRDAAGEKYRGLSTDDDAPKILVQQVSHHSRVHLDIETDNIEAEVRRLVTLGAREIDRLQDWVVLEAPSGHRFCVVPERRRDFADDATTWD